MFHGIRPKWLLWTWFAEFYKKKLPTSIIFILLHQSLAVYLIYLVMFKDNRI
jgi:hypothetical protein